MAHRTKTTLPTEYMFGFGKHELTNLRWYACCSLTKRSATLQSAERQDARSQEYEVIVDGVDINSKCLLAEKLMGN
jgi:hypothetical protein